jgi:hypothetical protein
MRLAIMQPYFMPYIGYFQLIAAVDKFVIFDDVNYIKGGWINRNTILNNGVGKLFTIKLAKAKSNILINTIDILDNFQDFKKTIRQNYSKAPYFTNVYPVIEHVLEFENNNLALFNMNSLEIICNHLDIKTEFILSSTLLKDNSLRGQEKILQICELLKSDNYINSIGGTDLYDTIAFGNKCIQLSFLKPSQVEYKQFNFQFVPWLSIIDILMFNSIDNVKKYLDDYSIVKK